MATSSVTQVDRVLLRPRPVTHPSVNIVLVPLLPTPPPRSPIPDEVWVRILKHTLGPEPDARTAWEGQIARLSLIRVCKSFKEVVLPLLYARPHLPSFDSFVLFCERLLDADQKWDNLRRIQHSTPGRWVESLDLTLFSHLTQSEYLKFDKLICQLFSVVPFMSHLALHTTVPLSRRAMQALSDAECIFYLKRLRGVLIPSNESFLQCESLTSLLRSCINIQHLELLGSGLDTDADFPDPDAIYSPPNFCLPHLSSMSILHIPFSPVLHVLSRAELPELRALTISIYADLPESNASAFLEAHASKLTTLTLSSAQTWPPTAPSIPADILKLCPQLRYLSLPTIPPTLTAPETPSQVAILSIPRPSREFLNLVERLFVNLREVRIREVRYLRRSMGIGAAAAGNSADMLEWNRRLARRRVIVFDALGRHQP